MSFFGFILQKLKKEDRTDREDVSVPCKFVLFKKGEAIPTSASLFQTAAIINTSPSGLGMVVAPALTEEQKIAWTHDDQLIYIECESEDNNAIQKITGQVRWVKTITDVETPFSELGITLVSIDDNTTNDILNSILTDSEIDENTPPPV